MLLTIKRKIINNWQAGFAVSLVSVPLAISLAIASQTTPVVGIITAIWAGLMASFFGGSNYNIVGPTGALSGILATFAIVNGAESLAMLAIVSGIFILIANFFKLERYLVFVPASAIQGFILGVACIVSFNQIFSAFGQTHLKATDKCLHNVLEAFRNYNEIVWPAFIVFVIFLVGLIVLSKYISKVHPAILLAPVGIVLGYFSQVGMIPWDLPTLATKYGNFSAKLFELPKFYFHPKFLLPGLTVAVVAIIETMISARIADGATKTKHNKKKEMFGLGVANIVSGFAGGMPATAALARTALNIKTGAKDKMSATICCIFITLISLILMPFFRYIPMAIIAAILVFVSIKMIEKEHFWRMYKLDKKSFVLSLIVAFVTIYEDPIVGILFGAAASMLIFMEKISQGHFEYIAGIEQISSKIQTKAPSPILGTTLIYSLKGQLAYINAQSHVTRFESNLQPYNTVILNLKELYFIDLDGIDAFTEIVEQIENQGKRILIIKPNQLVVNMLQDSKKFCELKNNGLVFDTVKDALESSK